jgi:hypothetical protein
VVLVQVNVSMLAAEADAGGSDSAPTSVSALAATSIDRRAKRETAGRIVAVGALAASDGVPARMPRAAKGLRNIGRAPLKGLKAKPAGMRAESLMN